MCPNVLLGQSLLLIKPCEVAEGQASWLKEARSSIQLAGTPTSSATAPYRRRQKLHRHQKNEWRGESQRGAATSSAFSMSSASSHLPLPYQYNNRDIPLRQHSGQNQSEVMCARFCCPWTTSVLPQQMDSLNDHPGK